MLETSLISGLIPDIEDGYGVTFRDLNQDGYADIYLVCFRNLNRLLINNGGIIPFVDRSTVSGLGGNLMPRGRKNLELGSCAADYDNDGKPDIFLAGWGKTFKLFRNDGAVNFSDVTENLNLQGAVDANQGLWFDANNDGYLDLYITDEHKTNRFLINQKNGTFREVLWTNAFIDTATSQGGCSGDFDGDGDIDIYIANWNAPDYLLLNDGKGQFTPAKLLLPTLTENYRTNSAVCADINNDGALDLIVMTMEGRIFLYRNQTRNGLLQFSTEQNLPFARVGYPVYGALLEDFDQDGWTDCFFTVRGAPNRLYLNDGRGGFLSTYSSDGRDAYSTGASAADFDNDGDLDIFVSNKDALSAVYLNPVNNDRYIKLNLTGVRSNRDAIGSKVYFYSHGDSLPKLVAYREITVQSGYLSTKAPLVHIGAGRYDKLDVRIVFPSGKEVQREGLIAGRNYTITEYGPVISSLFFAVKAGRSLIIRAAFWINFALLILFIALIYGYMRFGLARYQWQAVTIASQLIIWFIISISLFIFLQELETGKVLTILNGLSLLVIIMGIAYSEHQHGLRRRRRRFRTVMQSLSDQMINIHSNEQLFSQLTETIGQHEGIHKTILLVNQDNKLNIARPAAKNIPGISLPDESLQAILKDKILYQASDETVKNIFNRFKVNILIPIRREGSLLGMLGIDMPDSGSPVNQEDLRLILTIANQTAVAIENNNYIEESARLIKQLTEAQIREEYLKQLEKTNKALDQKNSELTRLFKELQEKEAQLIHSEKMASLGQLVAGISHELNNPISFIYANTQALKEYIEELEKLWQDTNMPETGDKKETFLKLTAELKSIIADNISGSRNVKELVLNLKNFSRLDQADWKEARLVDGIESSLKILNPQVTAETEIVKDFRDDPPLFCNHGQMNQVFINLLSNAFQAINGRGKVTIRTFNEDDFFNVQIEDSGEGISKKNLAKIFDPFFTTKEVNKGSGLGLSISYSIVQKHGGNLLVESQRGKGSIFTVQLPLKSENETSKT